jgi:hypothetical protein
MGRRPSWAGEQGGHGASTAPRPALAITLTARAGPRLMRQLQGCAAVNGFITIGAAGEAGWGVAGVPRQGASPPRAPSAARAPPRRGPSHAATAMAASLQCSPRAAGRRSSAATPLAALSSVLESQPLNDLPYPTPKLLASAVGVRPTWDTQGVSRGSTVLHAARGGLGGLAAPPTPCTVRQGGRRRRGRNLRLYHGTHWRPKHTPGASPPPLLYINALQDLCKATSTAAIPQPLQRRPVGTPACVEPCAEGPMALHKLLARAAAAVWARWHSPPAPGVSRARQLGL